MHPAPDTPLAIELAGPPFARKLDSILSSSLHSSRNFAVKTGSGLLSIERSFLATHLQAWRTFAERIDIQESILDDLKEDARFLALNIFRGEMCSVHVRTIPLTGFAQRFGGPPAVELVVTFPTEYDGFSCAEIADCCCLLTNHFSKGMTPDAEA